MIGVMLDVVDLRAFYDTALGHVARRLVSRLVRACWQDHGTARARPGHAVLVLTIFARRRSAFSPSCRRRRASFTGRWTGAPPPPWWSPR
ncbi:MAG: hypothetical protein U1E25_12305 [Methylocystis sp.]